MDEINYIVSGLPRSGTSMMMQILYYGGFPIAKDDRRMIDEHNPKGYFEIDGIINKIQDNPSTIFNYKGKVLKIIAYGLKFLPKGNYKIIYMLRNIDEVLSSMEKMSGKIDRSIEKPLFEKLNKYSIQLLEKRDDIDYILVKYADVVKNPIQEIKRINDFLGGMLDIESASKAVDPNLYRNRANGPARI